MKNVALGIVYCFFAIITNKSTSRNTSCAQCNVKHRSDFADVGKLSLWNVKPEESKDRVGFGLRYIKTIN